MNHKMTAWRKNRKLGDVSGGRCWVKIEDRVFHRVHSLKPPVAGAELPIVVEDNPSGISFSSYRARIIRLFQTVPQG